MLHGIKTERQLMPKNINEDIDKNEHENENDLEVIKIKRSKIFKEQRIQPLENDNSNDIDIYNNNIEYSLQKTITLLDDDYEDNNDNYSQDIFPSEIALPQTRKLPLSHLTLKTSCNIINNEINEPLHPFLSSKTEINPNDIQQLQYEYQKELCHISIRKEESFLVRMLFDVYKRQTKTDKIDQLIESNKQRIDETKRIRRFNRLIEDANRRLEVKESLEYKKQKLLRQQCVAPKLTKKYKTDEWLKIYNDRFVQYAKEKKEKLKEKTDRIREKENETEKRIIKERKTLKAPLKVIQVTSQRMFDEAKKREERLIERKSKLETQYNNCYRNGFNCEFDKGWNKSSRMNDRDSLTMRNYSQRNASRKLKVN